MSGQQLTWVEGKAIALKRVIRSGEIRIFGNADASQPPPRTAEPTQCDARTGVLIRADQGNGRGHSQHEGRGQKACYNAATAWIRRSRPGALSCRPKKEGCSCEGAVSHAFKCSVQDTLIRPCTLILPSISGFRVTRVTTLPRDRVTRWILCPADKRCRRLVPCS